ncbi:MAG: hypothetical protein DRJ50_06640 [Actinobacteria bacterium]|nr:MAG: hypothetical protein DRJ50_06640 [Actinomycetota bacterium]
MTTLGKSSRRILRAAAVGILVALVFGSPALADPAGPTDYLSEVVAIDPSTPTIEVAILGGDSFVQLKVQPGSEVIVIGYRGEQYLWFKADGTVLENQNSPTKYTNNDRYGGGDIPPSATVDASPDWQPIASNGRWSWHDHRAHWMQQTRPFGQSAGDQILEAVVPLQVDGVEVDVTIISTWQPEPSPVPVWGGLLAGLILAVGTWFTRAKLLPAVVLTLPAVAAALLAGTWQYFSLPSETAPRLMWWILPAIALVCSIIGIAAGVTQRRFVADAALLLVGVELAIWGFFKRDGLSAAIIPTDAPGWFDRLATAMAISGGVGFAIVAVWFLFRLPAKTGAVSESPVSDSREQSGSPSPAHP